MRADLYEGTILPLSEPPLHATVDPMLGQCEIPLHVPQFKRRLRDFENDRALEHLLPWRERAGLSQDCLSFGILRKVPEPAPIPAVFPGRPTSR